MKTAVWASMLGAAALLAAAGCSTEPPVTAASMSGAPSLVAVRLASYTPPTTAGALAADQGPDQHEDSLFAWGHGHWWLGRVRPTDVDSLVVTVTSVQVRSEVPDSEEASDSAERQADSVEDAADSAERQADSAGEAADSGERAADSMGDQMMNDQGEGDRGDRHGTWVSLNLVGSGHLDLMHLPDSASGGLMGATDSLPAGSYRHVRIFVTSPMIYFDTTLVTPAGDTLKAHTGYPVKIPSADSTGAAIKTDESFTVPTGGSATVPLYFDRDDTVRHIILTGDGTIIVPPVMH